MSSIRFRHQIPANEADFELLCLELLRAEWSNPGLDLYAHKGEEQSGIDIIDLTAKEPLSAAQCKLHDPGKTIPPAEINGEVLKAEQFAPKLGRYAILTTAKASKKAHDTVLEINRKHGEQGLFPVELITWGKIENLLDKHISVRDAFYATLSGRKANEITSKLSEIRQALTSRSDNAPEPAPPATLPTADNRRFAIAIAHLTHDRDNETERLIVESLRDLAGVQILRFDRMISADGPVPEDSEREAHTFAQELLNESSADVLIWGTVLSQGGRSAPRLYWTTARQKSRSRQPYIPENFLLPEIFWQDLAEVLKLLVVTQSSELFARRGKRNSVELSPFVEKVRNILGPKDGSQRGPLEPHAAIQYILAMGLQQLGLQTRNRDLLDEAIHRYNEVLKAWTYEKSPGQWIAARNGLGIATAASGNVDANSSRLSEALNIFRELHRKSIHGHMDRISTATVENNLGNVLVILGERRGDIEQLNEAADHYRSTLTIWAKDLYPSDWATAQDHLGYALQLAGARSGEMDLLRGAVEAHRRALEEMPRDQVPLYWAQTQNHLGGALKSLGEREPGTDLLEQAADAYRLTLQERAFHQEPLEWAETQSNLGAVLTHIADRSGNETGLGEAVDVLRESLKVRTLAAEPLAFASSSNNLGHALVRLGEFTGEVQRFEEAIDVLRAALSVWTRDSSPARWSTAQQNLGEAYLSLARKKRNPEFLDSAKQAFESALSERDRTKEPLLWASTQAALGHLFYLKGDLEEVNEALEDAIAHFRLALEQYQSSLTPTSAGIQFNLGNVQRLLGKRTNRLPLILEALERHSAACRYSLPLSPYWAFRAAEAAKEDFDLIRFGSDRALLDEATTKYGWILDLLQQHSGHQIALAPNFTAVVAGTSGMTKPDFSVASRKGDRIRDGSVVWENAGKQSFCSSCNCFLIPPKE